MPLYSLEIIVVALGLVMLLIEAFMPKLNHKVVALLGVGGLTIVFVMLFGAKGAPEDAGVFWTYYSDGTLARFYKGIALVTTIFVMIIGLEYVPVLRSYLSKRGGGVTEFFCLPMFICAGLMWMASATDLTSIFVSLELVTISFYVMVAYMRRNVGSLEAGVKYLVLGALSTGFFVYGITWLFGLTGQTNLAEIAKVLPTLEGQDQAILFTFALILVGLGFKVAAVPFQVWVPDVYQGAPTPVTAHLSVGSKAAGFIVMSRMIAPFLEVEALQGKIVMLLLIVAGATIIYGNLAAIPQGNVKRLLSFSSIAHAGFLILALACSFYDQFPIESATVAGFYLATYVPMTLCCFLVLAVVRSQLEAEDLGAFDGLHKRSPFLAFAMLIGLVSLAGIPLTAGFLGKLFVFGLAVDQGHYVLLALALVGAGAGFYYYFKVIRAMYWHSPADEREVKVGGLTKAALGVMIVMILFVGVNPESVLQFLPLS